MISVRIIDGRCRWCSGAPARRPPRGPRETDARPAVKVRELARGLEKADVDHQHQHAAGVVGEKLAGGELLDALPVGRLFHVDPLSEDRARTRLSRRLATRAHAGVRALAGDVIPPKGGAGRELQRDPSRLPVRACSMTKATTSWWLVRTLPPATTEHKVERVRCIPERLGVFQFEGHFAELTRLRRRASVALP
jgi:hypothetical protein